ncbi:MULTISPECIES: helix-turn-helix domain-containing protein [unclassified Pseudactinotalea]|uniref:TetR/AcrR family transcriptional regulator n=1 Tax=Micrococcales TaxID=85006 RepID=UPI003C7BD660
MARASAAVAAETARTLLRVATESFASEGYAAVSLEDVARSAGVTRGAVYHHYRSKAGLFGAVAAALQADVAAAVVAAAEQSGTEPGAQLRAGSHAFLDAITAAPVGQILLIDAPAVMGWAQWRALDAEHSGAHLREVLHSVGVAPELLDATAAQLSGAMNEAALWLAQHPGDDAARAAAGRVLDRLLEAATP